MSHTDLVTPSAPTEARPDLRRHRLVVRVVPPLVLTVLGLIELLQDPALWYDEAYSRLAATVPLSTLLSGVWHRVGVIGYLMDVPPSFNAPYYVLLHLWVSAAGDSAFALRLPTLLCAAAATGVVAEFVRRLAGTGPGLLAGLLCACGPLYLDQAVQARGYGPALLATCLCALWLQVWDVDRRRPARVLAAAGVAALLHWFAIPVLVGFGVGVVVRHGRSGLPVAAGLLGSTLPALSLVIWSFAGGSLGAPAPVPVGITLPVDAVRDWSGGLVPLAVGLALALALALRQRPGRQVALLWFALPVAMVTAVELVRPTYYPRYLLFSLVGLTAAAALGIATLRRPRVRLAVGALLVVSSLTATIPDLAVSDREPSRAIITALAAEQRPGQPIIPADGRTALDLETYLALAPRLADDLVLPPTLFTDQTSSDVVWLVRVVLQQHSMPVVPAEQRLLDAGWERGASTTIVGATTNLRIQEWTRAGSG